MICVQIAVSMIQLLSHPGHLSAVTICGFLNSTLMVLHDP